MGRTLQSKTDRIAELYSGFCFEKLDDEYFRLCNNLFDNLQEFDKNVFERGDENIWAASIIWAIGTVNFLGDKLITPYSSLSDVCDYFAVNTSTVGQKASKIRSWLDISYFSDDYIRSDLQKSNFFDNLVVNEDGLIVTLDMIEDEDILMEEELPDHYTVIIDVKPRTKQADIYQLEYLFKTLMDEDEYFEKTEIIRGINIHLSFYGRPHKVLLLEKELNNQKFLVVDLVNHDID